MSLTGEEFGELRRSILSLKDAAIALKPRVDAVDDEAGERIHAARLALFEAWTLLVGPPDEEEDD